MMWILKQSVEVSLETGARDEWGDGRALEILSGQSGPLAYVQLQTR